MCVFKQEKYIQFCLQDWLVAKYAFKIPLYLFYSISPNSNQPGFPHAQHSTVFQQPVSRFPPSLTNSWVMPIKVPAANTQSSLPSFKPLQCPSCPETNFCQKEKKSTTYMNQDAVTAWPAVHFHYYWPCTGARVCHANRHAKVEETSLHSQGSYFLKILQGI